MPVAYLDASAVLRLVRREHGSDQLQAFLAGYDAVSSELVITETLRAVRRWVDAGETEAGVDELERDVLGALSRIALVGVDADGCFRAGRLPGPIRALDALHVESAQSLGAVDVFVTYDRRQAAAARMAGLRTSAPGA